MRFCLAFSILLLFTASSSAKDVEPAAIKTVNSQNNGRQNAPSLAETEHWIENTFTDENVGYVQTFSSDNVLDQSYSIVFEGCTLGLESYKTHQYNGPQNEQQSSIIDYVDLKDIDPGSIEVDGHIVIWVRRAIVGFRITNDERKITEFSSPTSIEELVPPSLFEKQPHYSPNRAFKTYSLESGIVMAPEYATRFIKAMRHATELCGGRRSTF